tara:strand:+ start:941 stop:1108 length:168 start_codon:yes stop_codon:yes gene_type:complete
LKSTGHSRVAIPTVTVTVGIALGLFNRSSGISGFDENLFMNYLELVLFKELTVNE